MFLEMPGRDGIRNRVLVGTVEHDFGDVRFGSRPKSGEVRNCIGR